MDLGSPLRAIAPSLESSVLAVLAGTESGLNAMTIARLSGTGSRTGQRPVINRLVRQGDRVGRASQHRLSVQAESVAHAGTVGHCRGKRPTGNPPSPAGRHRRVGPARPLSCGYGSFARAEAGENSDVDLLIINADDFDTHVQVWQVQIDGLADYFLLWTGNRLEVSSFRKRSSRKASTQ